MRNYTMTVRYDGPFDSKLDRAILRVVHGRGGKGNAIEFQGSGYGFGQRDMSFTVPSRTYATGVKARLAKLDKGIRVECEEAYDQG